MISDMACFSIVPKLADASAETVLTLEQYFVFRIEVSPPVHTIQHSRGDI